MGQMKDIAVQYVDYLLKTGQITDDEWNETLQGILDGDIGIAKAWLISEIYDGDIVAMEAECGTMVTKQAECNTILEAESFNAEKPTRECPNCGVVMGEEYQAVDCCGTTVCDDCVAWVFSVDGGRWDDLVIDGTPPSADEKKSWENLRSDGDVFCHKCLEKIIPNAYDQGYDAETFEAEDDDSTTCEDCGVKIGYDEAIDWEGLDRCEDCYDHWMRKDRQNYTGDETDCISCGYSISPNDSRFELVEGLCPDCKADGKRAESFEANYNPQQSRDNKGRWAKAEKPTDELLGFGQMRQPTTPEEDKQEYDEHLENVHDELYEESDEDSFSKMELGDYQEIPPLTEVFDEGADAETLMMFLTSAANDEHFPDKYLDDEEFQEAVHQMVALLDAEIFVDVVEMWDDLDQIASLTSDPNLKGFVRRAHITTQLLTDIKQQQEEWSAESYTGAAETFEAKSHFPPGKHDVIDSEAALKVKHPAVTQINSYDYLIFQQGTSNKFLVFFDTNSGYYNVYGSIGYAGKVVGPLTSTKYHDKIRSKIRKGYRKMQV